MSFDRIARHYRWIEAVSAGNLLQRTRVAWLDEVRHCRRALIIGEGNGRFLSALLASNPAIEVTCVDASRAMLELAKQRIHRDGHDATRVTFVHADVLTWMPPCAAFDLIVTHFLLDCLQAHEVDVVVDRLSQSATAGACWLLADFCQPSHWRTRIILALLYRFFGFFAGLTTRHLTDPRPRLEAHGYRIQKTLTFDCGLLHSDLWECGEESPLSGRGGISPGGQLFRGKIRP